MVIHVVRSGDTLYSLSRSYGVPLSLLLADNGLSPSDPLVVGQALIIQFPETLYTVRPGDTLRGIARKTGLSLRQLRRNNPVLGGLDRIYPDQTLVLSYRGQKEGVLSVNGYAYPFIERPLLTASLPYLTYLTPFTYGFTPSGELIPLEDSRLITLAELEGTASVMHLSTLTRDGGFSNDLSHAIFTDQAAQTQLIENLVGTILNKGYRGLDVDFEYVYAEDAAAYAAFIARLHRRLAMLDRPVIAALAPKISATQTGRLYEGHNYAALGAAADWVFLMTYEWGYTYGPPMAVAPLPNVRQVVQYALTKIPSEKIWLGLPSYGYDWPLPFLRGQTKARSISPKEALRLARQFGAEIQYDETAQAPWFRYTGADNILHEVWFEDVRSMRAKLALVPQYGLYGAGYWNLMRPFPQNWTMLNALYKIRDP